ncbi:MAG: hypothetical protein VB133_13820 [Anaeromusa sp.]|uniref:hypothetical protein n=1 Tax=Anaeromusa sp. TaxID=1872520 RepID=UPI002B21A658|nr:hypothetical protein [Anaeromusa sp.]MEA4836199.1 hypothetical protein [Anaeromusa sp.]
MERLEKNKRYWQEDCCVAGDPRNDSARLACGSLRAQRGNLFWLLKGRFRLVWSE